MPSTPSREILVSAIDARRWATSLLAAFVLIAASGSDARAAQITSEKQVGPRVVELTISTTAFSEPTKVNVNLPTGYDADPGRRWPVTYFLAGTMNTYRTFNTLIDGVGLTANYPSIVVSPNGDSGYWSDWYNAGAFGPPMYESYVIEQLIGLIDARFRTNSDRSHRAVFGASMGGYGAMMAAARHPDLFAAAGSVSGAVDSNLLPNAFVLSLSPTFQGGQFDAIYGPRLVEEVRWRGHNPTDLVDNLRSLDLQVRTGNGIPNPGIGENLLSADSVSCLVELGVWAAGSSMHAHLDHAGIPHQWRDYGPGCHTAPNFTRQVADTLQAFAGVFADPPPSPASFDYKAIEPEFDVWGWNVNADPGRALEFLQLRNAGAGGLTLIGSGTTRVTTPPLFAGAQRVDLEGAEQAAAIPDSAGRISFQADLGAPNSGQQYRLGVVTPTASRTVTFQPLVLPAPAPNSQPGAATPKSPKARAKKRRCGKRRNRRKARRCKQRRRYAHGPLSTAVATPG